MNISFIPDSSSQGSQRISCYLSDGDNFFTPCIIPVKSNITLREDSIIILQDYSFYTSPHFGKPIIEVYSYRSFPDVPDTDSVPDIDDNSCVFDSNPVAIISTPERQPSPQGVPLLSQQAIQYLPIGNPIPQISSESPLVSGGLLDLSPRVSRSMTPSKRPAFSQVHFSPASSLLAKRTHIAPERPIPIFNLSFQSSWTIKGRVTVKGALGPLKHGGNWFYFELSDLSGTIKINAFQAETERFFGVIKLGHVYAISNGELKPAKLPFNTTKHLREITLKHYSIIREELDFHDADFPNVPSNFTKISHLRNSPISSVVDVIGVCVFVTLVNKGACRSVLIQDDSSTEIRLSIWNLSPNDFNPPIGSIIVARRARLTQQHCGLILTVAGCATVDVNPDLPEAVRLLDWFNNHGSSTSFTSLSKGFFGEISLINSLPQSLQDDAIIYTNLEVIIISGCGYVYKAHTVCGRRIKIYQRDIPVCESCLDTLPQLSDQLLLTLGISDSSGSVEVSVFTDVALDLLSKTTNDIPNISDASLSLAIEGFIGKTFQLCIKSRMTFFHGEHQLQHSVKYFSEKVALEV
ncbi:replication protein A 70 kDa DNA-binding subunit-like [Tetranychus urticae]|uniref:replication protein A 70 kDa DNA-binding subunit-like n=1 Tax=Tetranychus urticae TaxID=32264 RepID=UPI00077B8876|nr:replication protein A 70 kDa DNA-binding subunit-like [Tetranychus urticae]